MLTILRTVKTGYNKSSKNEKIDYWNVVYKMLPSFLYILISVSIVAVTGESLTISTSSL